MWRGSRREVRALASGGPEHRGQASQTQHSGLVLTTPAEWNGDDTKGSACTGGKPLQELDLRGGWCSERQCCPEL